ncbi:hypothetical protein ACUL41_18395 [Virgibacillus natechei]
MIRQEWVALAIIILYNVNVGVLKAMKWKVVGTPGPIAMAECPKNFHRVCLL